MMKLSIIYFFKFFLVINIECIIGINIITLTNNSDIEEVKNIQNSILFHNFEDGTENFLLNLENRIVGGVEATLGEFPFVVSIQITNNNLINQQSSTLNYKHACGGSILNEHWIITAAHCAYFNQSRYRIVAGVNDLLHFKENEQIVKVKKLVIHPQYNSETLDYDIALIQVQTPFQLTNFVKSVELPLNQLFSASETAESVGWGLLSKNDKETTPILQKIRLPVIPEIECRDIYDKLNITISNRMICAGINEGESVCNGDSGGPLLCDSLNGQYLCGLVSWGIPCAVQGYPGVFTKLSVLLDFIRFNFNNCVVI